MPLRRFGVLPVAGFTSAWQGLESVTVGLKSLIDEAAALGVNEVVVGMPHRGRLNVLANVIRKPMEQIFQEFSGIFTQVLVATPHPPRCNTVQHSTPCCDTAHRNAAQHGCSCVRFPGIPPHTGR